MFVEQLFFTTLEQHTSLIDFFSWKAEEPSKRLLLVGEQGTGKTTSIKSSVSSWCHDVLQTEHGIKLRLKYALDYLHEEYHTLSWNEVKSCATLCFYKTTPIIEPILHYFKIPNSTTNYIRDALKKKCSRIT